MNKRLNEKFYKEFVYGESIWRIDIVQYRDSTFGFEVSEKTVEPSYISNFIPFDSYKNPREAIRDIKRFAI